MVLDGIGPCGHVRPPKPKPLLESLPRSRCITALDIWWVRLLAARGSSSWGCRYWLELVGVHLFLFFITALLPVNGITIMLLFLTKSIKSCICAPKIRARCALCASAAMDIGCLVVITTSTTAFGSPSPGLVSSCPTSTSNLGVFGLRGMPKVEINCQACHVVPSQVDDMVVSPRMS